MESIHLPRSRLAVLQRTSARFSWTEVSKAAGQAVPEIPLSVGRTTWTSQSFCLCQFPYNIYTAIYIHVHVHNYTWTNACVQGSR